MSKNSTVNELYGMENTPVDEKSKKNKAKKITVVITYLIALLCLLAGLLVPLYQYGQVSIEDGMMIKYIPSMVNNVIVMEIVPELPWFISVPFKGAFDFTSLVSVLYALLCVVAVIMFIPVCAGNKNKRTSANCALVVEVLALVVLLFYIAYDAFILVVTNVVAWADYNILIAFGGTLLITIIQSITTKGSIGVSKTVAVILSAICVVALVDITLFAPFLSDPLNSLSGMINSGDTANFVGGLFGGVPGSEIGLFGITSLFGIRECFEFLDGDTLKIVLYVLWILVAVFTVVNMVVDILGLGTGKKFKANGEPCKNSASNTFALVRYVLTFVLAVAMIAFAILLEGITSGVFLYLLAILLFIQIINAAGRTIAANRRVKKYTAAAPVEETQNIILPEPAFAAQEAAPAPSSETVIVVEPVYQEPVYIPEPVVEEPVAEEPVVEEEPFEYAEPIDYTPIPEEPVQKEIEQPAAEPAPTVYFYAGDTDEFMETLTDPEKIEFVEVFIKRTHGKVNGVPQYIIHEDNSEFFPAVFIHVNRYRGIVSDGLMTKMYKQLGKVM